MASRTTFGESLDSSSVVGPKEEYMAGGQSDSSSELECNSHPRSTHCSGVVGGSFHSASQSQGLPCGMEVNLECPCYRTDDVVSDSTIQNFSCKQRRNN